MCLILVVLMFTDFVLVFQNPIQLQDEKTICCWCCADGPISMDVYLERGVFVLGEPIKLKIDIENSSNESLQQIKVELINVSRLKCFIQDNILDKVDNPHLSAIFERGCKQLYPCNRMSHKKGLNRFL